MQSRFVQQNLYEILRRYSIAILTVVAAFTVTYLASKLVEPGVSPLFLIAVMISAWRGGLGVGLFATALSAFISAFVFLPPVFSLQIDRGDILLLSVFTVAAVITGSLSAARKRAEEAREILLVKEQAARAEAERASRVKDELLAAVSHELRTPLTTIKTLTRVLQRREMTDEEREEYLTDIASECDREIDLVLNLLDLSRIRAGGVQIRLQPVAVADVIGACEKLVRGDAEKHNHHLVVAVAEDLPPVRADHSALRRALCAIAENAIKYTSDVGRVTMRAHARRPATVVIEIEDNGRGIPEKDLPRIFEKFYRGGNSGGGAQPGAEEVPGIGLGLNLAKVLIEGMNGEIAVESRLHKERNSALACRSGMVTIKPKMSNLSNRPPPVSARKFTARSIRLRIMESVMNKQLLIVDDEPKLLRAVAVDLRGEGYQVTTAGNGAEALISVAQKSPDLIISDIRMPGMDGYELARRLRRNESTALIPIVFLTAKDTTNNRIEGFRSGVDAYLTKPFEPDELLAVVASILNRVERTHSQIARLIGREEIERAAEKFYDEELTDTETRVAEAVSRGLSNKEIAREFGISVRTVEHHIRSILSKKNFSNRVEIALFVKQRASRSF
jgi:signal transduction histidine kinase/DNA-binding NarL/FixJ family response regulator